MLRLLRQHLRKAVCKQPRQLQPILIEPLLQKSMAEIIPHGREQM